MRFKVNKALYGRNGRNDASAAVKVGPLNKDGTPDMRCNVNKEKFSSPCPTSSVYTSVSGMPSGGARSPWELPLSSGYVGGPLKKDGTPDMRYAVNKQRCVASSAATGASSHGPLKKNGTPDLRYAVNRQSRNTSSPSSKASGPLKKDGTPDMRFKANRR